MFRFFSRIHHPLIINWLGLQVLLVICYWGAGIFNWQIPFRWTGSFGLQLIFLLVFALSYLLWVGYIGHLFNLRRPGNWISGLPIDRARSTRIPVLLVLGYGAWIYYALFPVLRAVTAALGIPALLFLVVFPLLTLACSIRSRHAWIGAFGGGILSLCLVTGWILEVGTWAKLQWRIEIELVAALIGFLISCSIIGKNLRSQFVVALALIGIVGLPELYQRLRSPSIAATILFDLKDYPFRYKVDRLTNFIENTNQSEPLWAVEDRADVRGPGSS